MSEPIIYELGKPGRRGVSLPTCDVPQADLPPTNLLRQELDLPEISERDFVSHYLHLAHLNYSIDEGFYPLGSCTMKYNPKVNEVAARISALANLHPHAPATDTQGSLQILYEVQKMLASVSGFSATSLQPAAGAQGELAGILMIRAYHASRGDAKRQVIIIPDSAHGTNPASTTMAGFRTVSVQSDARGNVDLGDLEKHLDDNLAGMMLTNPNTLGLFDEHVLQVTKRVHQAGGLMYGDGANFNALMGVAKPAELGFDVMHFNLHKTFSTPHGGGGPGSGPVSANDILAPFLPGPIVCKTDGENGSSTTYRLEMPAQSIGRLKAFHGHFGVILRAYVYLRMLGADGLRQVTESAVLSANYVQQRLKKTYPLPYDRTCMHEFVLEGMVRGADDIRALDICKRLIDYGVHPPTNYFPLIVHEALMIEPTETESKETLDRFCEIMEQIAEEAVDDPDLLHNAPASAPTTRLDEVRAARRLVLRWQREHDEESAD